MRRQALGTIVGAALALGMSGCAATRQARYVYQDGEYGVVAIPQNTSTWPANYREQAARLMAEHFPEGYEVVRAEEVVEGSRTLTVNGATTAEIEAGLVAPILKLGKLGRTATRNQSDSLKIKECRIVYKKADPDGPPRGFASVASLTPTMYVDPNVKARRGEDEPALAAHSADKEKEGDWGKPKGEEETKLAEGAAKAHADKSTAPGRPRAKVAGARAGEG